MGNNRRSASRTLFVGAPLPRWNLDRVALRRRPTRTYVDERVARVNFGVVGLFLCSGHMRSTSWRTDEANASSTDTTAGAEHRSEPVGRKEALTSSLDAGNSSNRSNRRMSEADTGPSVLPCRGDASLQSTRQAEFLGDLEKLRSKSSETSQRSLFENTAEALEQTIPRELSNGYVHEESGTARPEPLLQENAADLLAPFPRPARLRILLMGKPASGKGTQAPLIARRFGMVHISMGSLLRNEVRAGTELGLVAIEYMNRGDLVPDDIVLAMLRARLAQEDCRENGYVLDGYPRTVEQARKLDEAGVLLDHVIVLERADADALDWALERVIDPITGMMYHPRLAPPPPHVLHRLERRSDDNAEIMRLRLAQYAEEAPRILARYRGKITVVRTDNARPYLDAFREISQVLERLILRNATDESSPLRADQRQLWRPRGRQHIALPRGALLETLETFASRVREKDYVPLYASTEEGAAQIGFVGRTWASELLTADIHHEVFDIQLESCSLFGPNTTDNNGFVRFRSNITTEKLALVMAELRDRGLIEGWRNEKVPLRLGPGRSLEIERACMAYLGIETSGVHINGYFYRAGNDGSPELCVWLARRSWAKPTYPGRLDQLTAGGLPAGALSVQDHALQELHEEASYTGRAPTPVGCLRYRYETRKGLSAKVLYLYDLELDERWTPRSLDGEAETFYAVSAREALASLVEAQHEWKPNSALVLIDFLIRHGVIHPDNEPDYASIVTRVRCCGV
jgi:adenylate kinase